MNVCPTAAIRIKYGKATINEAACTDCGMCLKTCPRQAIYVEQDDFNQIFKFSYRIILLPSVFIGQFPEDISEERMEAIKQRAHDEYLRRMEAQAAQKVQHRKSLHHRAIAATVLVLALLVLPVVYTVLMPVTVGNANNVIRSAGIWINNTFHLGIEFSEPIPENENFSDVGDDDVKTFATVEEAAAYLKCPLFYLVKSDLSPNLITAYHSLGKLIRVQLNYTIGENNFSILQRPMLESNIEAVVSNTESVTSPAGNIIVWESNNKYRGMCISDGWIVNILFDGTRSDAIELFKSLHMLINTY